MKAALIMLFMGCQSWTHRDSMAEASMVSLLTVDWLQTDGIVKECREINPIIGECGERVSPHIYFPVVIAASIMTAHLLPIGWRPLFHGIVIGVEGAVVVTNAID